MPLEGFFGTVAKNSIFSVSGKLSLKLIAFLFTLIIIRWLGQFDYGAYALIWSYVVVYSIIADLGLDMFAVREIAGGKRNYQYVVANSMVLKAFLSIAAICLIIATAWLLGHRGQFLLQLFLASLILLLYAVLDPLDALLRGHNQFDKSTLAIVAGLIIFVGSGIFLLLAGWGITGVIVARLSGVIFSSIVAWYLTRKHRPKFRWQIKPALWPGYVRASLPFGLNKVWFEWALRIDVIIIVWFWNEEYAGWYAAAFALLLGILVVASAINSALLPTISKVTEMPVKSTGIYESVIRYQLIFSLPIAAVGSLLSTQIVELLFGPNYAPAAPVLALIIWLIPFVSIAEFFRYVLLVRNNDGLVMKIFLLSALLRLLLLFWLVPIYGLLGAATAVLFTEIVLICLYFIELRLKLKSTSLWEMLGKPFLATLLGLAVVYGIASLYYFPIAIGVGGFVYVLLLLSIKAIHPNEVSQLLPIFRPHVRDQSRGINREKSTLGSQQPLVSVFIPVFNGQRFIAQAIDSVLKQSYDHYELLILDDNSTDNTLDILRKFESHPRVRIHTNSTNLGMARNWNLGIQLCKGEYVAKLDADDYYEPHYLERSIDFLRRHQDAGMVFSGSNLLYPDGRREPELHSLRCWVKTREEFLPTLLQSCVIRSPTVCVRRSCYDLLGGFVEDMRLHADWEMWVRIAANYPVGYIARRLANYRMSHGNNCTAQSLAKGWSIQDIQTWRDLLSQKQLPYSLTPEEDFYFRWGIYNLEMHFAAIASNQQIETMRQSYIQFAETILPHNCSAPDLDEMRQTYAHLHRGIHAFRENKFDEALCNFFQAIKPRHISRAHFKLNLSLKVIKRTVADLAHYYLVKYYPGL